MNPKIKLLTEQFNESYRKFQEQMKTTFHECCKEIFEKYPDLKNFSVIGYTPYFNDGDECTYSLHAYWDYGLTLNGYNQDDFSGNRKSDEKIDGYTYAEYEKIGEEIESFLNSIPDSFFKDAFGDHCRIIISRENVTTEGYDHD